MLEKFEFVLSPPIRYKPNRHTHLRLALYVLLMMTIFITIVLVKLAETTPHHYVSHDPLDPNCEVHGSYQDSWKYQSTYNEYIVDVFHEFRKFPCTDDYLSGQIFYNSAEPINYGLEAWNSKVHFYEAQSYHSIAKGDGYVTKMQIIGFTFWDLSTLNDDPFQITVLENGNYQLKGNSGYTYEVDTVITADIVNLFSTITQDLKTKCVQFVTFSRPFNCFKDLRPSFTDIFGVAFAFTSALSSILIIISHLINGKDNLRKGLERVRRLSGDSGQQTLAKELKKVKSKESIENIVMDQPRMSIVQQPAAIAVYDPTPKTKYTDTAPPVYITPESSTSKIQVEIEGVDKREEKTN